MAYTRQTGFPQVASSILTGTQQTVPVTTVATGDIVMVHTRISQNGVAVANITDTNSRISWQSVKIVDDNDTTTGMYLAMWYGVVTSVGATTVTVTSNTSLTTQGFEVWVDEIHGPASTWTVDTSGSLETNVGSTTIPFPSLTPTGSNDFYWGSCFLDNTFIAGSTPGYTYSALSGNGQVFNGTLNLTAGVATQPTATQTSGKSQSLGALIFAGVSSTPSSPHVDVTVGV